MAAAASRGLRSAWPPAGVILCFVVGFVLAGFGAGLASGILSILVFGPAYLIQNSIRRRRGTLPLPPAKTPAERAESDAAFLRLMAIALLVLAIAEAALALADPRQWLPGRGWTAVLLLGAACGITSAPHLWAIAERRARQGRCARPGCSPERSSLPSEAPPQCSRSRTTRATGSGARPGRSPSAHLPSFGCSVLWVTLFARALCPDWHLLAA
jgi:hypothetical protein